MLFLLLVLFLFLCGLSCYWFCSCAFSLDFGFASLRPVLVLVCLVFFARLRLYSLAVLCCSCSWFCSCSYVAFLAISFVLVHSVLILVLLV
uniref:Putative product n=1 Tax=Xenopsylla cheopis TaxID=163159 RepID=A0A6M2DY89_XENCH